jgi:Icc protein
MQRRNFLKTIPLAAGALTIEPAGSTKPVNNKKPVLTIAHITDVHIREGDNAPGRFVSCLEAIKQKHKPDFFLNGGDTIHDASYDNVIREQVTAQWQLWDQCIKTLSDYEIYSCIGNHDPWWKAPSRQDEMYGIPYVVKRLKIPHNYYSFSKKGWSFFILDGNHEGITLGKEQMEWLQQGLQKLPANTPVLLMSHYPILTVTSAWEGGQHKDHVALKELFYKHKDKVKVCLSGHQHLLDSAVYNGISYFCNGAMSGFWWGAGNEKSAGKCYVQETPPGYAILKLYADGAVENEYHPHHY